MNVVKRSGKIEPLTKKKVFDSICNANMATAEENRITKKQITRITDTIFAVCEDMEDPIGIDMLEDAIERKLMEAQGYEVAKQYITYRYEKERIRSSRNLTEKLTASNT